VLREERELCRALGCRGSLDGADGAAAHGHGRARAALDLNQAETMIEALLTLAVSDQGKLSTEFTDLATWAEDAIDAAAPEIERLDLHVDMELDQPAGGLDISVAIPRCLAEPLAPIGPQP
jgi:signal transduction histidine kinase